MATRAEFEALMQQRIDEGDIPRANRIRVEKLGLPPLDVPQQPIPQQPNVDPQLQVDSGFQEFSNVMSGLPGNAMSGLAELGNSVGRSAAQGLDFIGPGTINAGLRLAGSDTQLPTFEGGFDEIPGSEGGFLQSGTGRDLLRGYGGAMPAALSMAPVAGRNIATPAGAAMDFMGLGAAKAQPSVAPLALGGGSMPATVPPATVAPNIPQLPSTRRVGDLITNDPGNVGRAGRQIDPLTGRVVADEAAQGSIKQGLDDGFIAMVQNSSPDTKAKMKDMLDALEGGRENFKNASIRRPLDVAGESMLERVNTVKEVNKSAGARLDGVAETLKGETIDVSPAIDDFIGSLRKMGVEFGDKEAISLGFDASDIALAKGPMKQIKELVQHMAKGDAPDAYQVHQLKRAIDEMVTYGKSKRGLGGKTERILKDLRRNLDGLLDRQFPQYNEVNTEYSETIGALDHLQSLVGKKNDIFDKYGDRVIGTLLRRIESNAQSGPNVLRAIEEMDGLAKKYATGGNDIVPYGVLRRPGTGGTKFGDDVREQVLFADMLNRKFGTPAGTSFQGEISKVVDKAAEDLVTGGGNTLTGLLSGGVKQAVNWGRGINEDNALKALRELVERQ